VNPAELRGRLADVRARIERAARRADRDPAAVRLVAISKTFSADFVRAAAEAGQRDFGENRVQEALPKMDAVRSMIPSDLALRWHLVGHLQTNKARKAGARFDVVHSIDTPDLLRKLDEAAASAGRRLDVLAQVDLAGEATKHGVQESELAAIFETGRTASHIKLVGLMLLPPAVDNPEDARPYFRRLREVRSRLLDSGVDPAMVAELSMGMSHDFEVAVEEGATIVRVGTAIFGSRPLTIVESKTGTAPFP
jgi:pyridoxal phosphate enzyme (YggS family)